MKKPIVYCALALLVIATIGWSVLYGSLGSRTIEPANEHGFVIEISASYDRPVIISPRKDDLGSRPIEVFTQFLVCISDGKFEAARGKCMMHRTIMGDGFIGSEYVAPIGIDVFQEYAKRLRGELSEIKTSSFALPGKSGFWHAAYQLNFDNGSRRESVVYMKKFDGEWKIIVYEDRFDADSDIDTIL